SRLLGGDRRGASRPVAQAPARLRPLPLRRGTRPVRGGADGVPLRRRPRRVTDDSRPLASGKIPLELLTRLLAELPPPPPELLLGARIGEDACGIELPAGILVVSADPITLTSEDVGRLSVIVNANDVAVTGARPQWFLAVVLVPPGTTEGVVDDL